jgi:hypothetical protein
MAMVTVVLSKSTNGKPGTREAIQNGTGILVDGQGHLKVTRSRDDVIAIYAPTDWVRAWIDEPRFVYEGQANAGAVS